MYHKAFYFLMCLVIKNFFKIIDNFQNLLLMKQKDKNA